MNIKRAKENIKDTVRLYLKKDAYGEYRIPVVRQRPIFLVGAPGIGKTAIMEQIAQELGIALVSYSMTHHTRQSALGLPFISHREYEGMPYEVSEYTMSEIISSVYDVMQKSGIKEGILFLDEINCVSETLAPSMLQFLQYKVFGRHKVPDGWVIVTAGNPREYNRSVREFDVVTLDRMKVLQVEADYEAWKAYAGVKGIHNAIMNYLELKKQDFYVMEMTPGGRSYVTARGWEDLSQIIQLYEEEGLSVDEELVGQYLRHERVVKEFTAYYDLYCKYQKDYHIEEILSGEAGDAMREKASAAPFDERISLLGMLTDKADSEMRDVMEQSDYLASLLQALKVVRSAVEKDAAQNGLEQKTFYASDGLNLISIMEKQIEGRKKLIQNLQEAGALSEADKQMHRRVIRFLEEGKKDLCLSELSTTAEKFAYLKQKFEEEVAGMKQRTGTVKERLHHLFTFVEQTFEDGNEMLLLMTHMTVTETDAAFIARFGCEDYQAHNDEMMLSERQNTLLSQIQELEL